jgi:hypothetical protein
MKGKGLIQTRQKPLNRSPDPALVLAAGDAIVKPFHRHP